MTMRKAYFINAALVVGTVLFSLAITEAYLRFNKPYWLTANFLLLPSIDKTFETEEFKTRVVTNSIGLRDNREFTPEHNGRYRIAAIGDSNVFGWGVDNEQAFPAVLEDILRKEIGPNLEVINFGRPGENPVGYLRTFKLHAKRLRPTMVVTSFLPANDCPLKASLEVGTEEEARQQSAILIQKGLRPWKTVRSYVGRMITTRATKPLRAWFRSTFLETSTARSVVPDPIDGSNNPLDPAALEKKLSGNPERLARYHALKEAGWVAKGERWKISPWLIRSAIFNPDFGTHSLFLDPKTYAAMNYQWAICENVIKAMAEIVEASGAKFVLLVLATAPQVSPEFLAAHRSLGIDIPDRALTDLTVNNKLKAFCDKEHLRCIDTLDATRRAAKDGVNLFYPLDGHPTADAHALFARRAASELAGYITDEASTSR